MKRALLLSVLLLGGCTEFWRGTWFGPDGEPVYPQGPAPPGHHRVEAGETLYSIAFRNQLDYRSLAEWNGLDSEARIREGQVLRLRPGLGVTPEIATAPSAEEGTRTYPTQPSKPSKSKPAPSPVEERRTNLRWQWPVKGPVLKRFSESAGSKGMDIGGEPGQAVLSAAAGRVVYSGSGLRGYGELIIIKHDDVYLSAYGYNRARLVKEGEKVRAGQLIAEMGAGPEQKPALHFELRQRGKPINPESVLPKLK